MKRPISLMSSVAAVLVALPASISAAEPKGNLANPDFTKGDASPAGAKHDWNLGATGLRGWMFCDKLVTTDARQISITKVEKDSPAAGILVPADVILGVGGKPFSYDPRTELGKALTIAESEAGGGNLVLTRWRAGKTEEVVVKLPVLGSYSATAPYNCPKSKRILEHGCKALAARMANPHASGAWMNEFGAWYFDLARRWDGSFPHQGPPEPDGDSYGGWDATGGCLLAYAMPLKKLYLTGKRPGIVTQLDPATAQSLILDGRGWDNKDRNSAYDKLGGDQLLECLASWSPIVRERAAMALARRKDTPVPALIKMLDAPSLNARYGACQALAALRGRATPAVEPLRKTLAANDLWLRIKAAEALAKIGNPAIGAVPELLKLLAQVDPKSDPRGMQQRYLSYSLFAGRGGMLGSSLESVDRQALYQAVRAGLRNQDGRARGCISTIYQQLSFEEIKPLLPATLQAVEEPAPSGEMFADEVRVEGLRVLSKHRIREGLAACVKYTRDQNPWDSQERTPKLMAILLTYGTHAKAAIPELTIIASYFDNDEKDFPRNLMTMKANCVRETIRAIEALTDTPELISIE